jgi:hypothetical protein
MHSRIAGVAALVVVLGVVTQVLWGQVSRRPPRSAQTTEEALMDPSQVACRACGARQASSEVCSACGKSLADALPVGKALAEVVALEALVEDARTKGHDVSYFEIIPHVARLGLETRWDLPEQETHRAEYVEWALTHVAQTADRLRDVLAGRTKALAVPPIPDYAKLELRDGYLRVEGEPVLLFGVNGDGPPELRPTFFAPSDLMSFTSAVGGTRYDYHTQPIWEAYQKYPDTHRVWMGGPWCGHIIVDRWSIGGGAKGECVVCLESPHTREACVEYMRKRVEAGRANPHNKFYSLGWEYAYICHCDRTLAMWRDWLRAKHGSVDALNQVWGTDFAGFAAVPLPAMDVTKIDNRAAWYDFARFNCSRFTDYMAWARQEVRKVDPKALTSTGAPFYMLAGQMGWAGIDQEALDRTVNDVILNEAQATTMATDLLRSFPAERKLLQDPEYHGDIAHIMAHFLHGDGRMSMWWWPRNYRPDPPSFYRTDIGRSPDIPLDDVATCLRASLDLRRLGRYVVPFHAQREEVALLYSHDSMLQLPPELRQSRNVPHVFALATLYEGTVYLDAPTRFVTERQIEEGRLGGLKLLILPAVEYQNPGTQAAILDWVRSGGTLVLTPNSWLADEYARPVGYLKDLGLRVEGMTLPEVRVSEARPDVAQGTGFIMGAISEVELRKVPKSTLTLAQDAPFGRKGPPLVGWGIQHSLSVENPTAKLVATFEDGRPAIVLLPLGEGAVYYFATPLEAESWHRFFDALYDALAVARPVRTVSTDGGNVHLVDSRTVPFEGGWLTYVCNLRDSPREVVLRLPEGATSVHNLSADEAVTLMRPGELRLSLGRFETVILRLTKGSTKAP